MRRCRVLNAVGSWSWSPPRPQRVVVFFLLVVPPLSPRRGGILAADIASPPSSPCRCRGVVEGEGEVARVGKWALKGRADEVAKGEVVSRRARAALSAHVGCSATAGRTHVPTLDAAVVPLPLSWRHRYGVVEGEDAKGGVGEVARARWRAGERGRLVFIPDGIDDAVHQSDLEMTSSMSGPPKVATTLVTLIWRLRRRYMVVAGSPVEQAVGLDDGHWGGCRCGRRCRQTRL